MVLSTASNLVADTQVRVRNLHLHVSLATLLIEVQDRVTGVRFNIGGVALHPLLLPHR